MTAIVKSIDYLTEKINVIDTRIIIFLTLAFNYTTFIINGNEEQYLTIAKQFFQPDWIPNSFHLNEWPGARILNQSISSFFLLFVSIPVFAFVAKWINFLLFSFPVAKFCKKLNISNIEFLFIFQLFYIYQAQGDQAFFGDEWIFESFQGKTLAYVFVFYALNGYLEGHLKKCLLFSIIATYLHVLVGGWFFAICLFAHLYENKNVFSSLKFFSKYLMFTLPLVLYLASTIVGGTKSEVGGVTFNWIYVYFRHAHHIGFFDDMTFFRASIFGGVRTIFSFFLICLIAKPYSLLENKKLNSLCIISLSMLFFFLAVGFADRFIFNRAGNFMLQLYPYRIAAISKFMTIFYFGAIVKVLISEKAKIHYLNMALLLAVSPIILSRTAKSAFSIVKSPGLGRINNSAYELKSFVEKQTKKSDIFFVNLNDEDLLDPSFFRILERRRYSSYKYVAAGTDKLFEWYRRVQESQKLIEEINYLDDFLVKNEANFYLANKETKHRRLNLVYANQDYFLYQIN